ANRSDRRAAVCATVHAGGHDRPAHAGAVALARAAGNLTGPAGRPLASGPAGASARPASARRAAPVEPQGPPVGTPVPVGAASTTGGSAGGIGGVFFFGLAALLAFAGLVRARVLFVLRRTPDAAWPQPFLALLERPG